MGKDQICIPFRVTQMAHMGWGRGGGNFPSSEGIKQEQKPSPSPFFTGARSREPAPSAHSRSCQVLGGPVQRGGGGGGGCGSPGCSRGKAGCVRGSPFPEGPLPLASREQEVKAGGANPRQGCRLGAARGTDRGLALAFRDFSEKLETLHLGGHHVPPCPPGPWSRVRPRTLLRPQSYWYQILEA